MVLKEKGTFRKDPKGNTGRLYIPAVIVRDSQFPIKEGDVEVEVEGDHLIIRAAPK